MQTNTDQMELDFNTSKTLRSLRRNRTEIQAAWWFKQMRRVVDLAIEWQPAPPDRPVQGFLLQ